VGGSQNDVTLITARAHKAAHNIFWWQVVAGEKMGRHSGGDASKQMNFDFEKRSKP
jgi:hypothetical protein